MSPLAELNGLKTQMTSNSRVLQQLVILMFTASVWVSYMKIEHALVLVMLAFMIVGAKWLQICQVNDP